MAASVSSKVSWCRPELSSPSSISSIAVTTITHLHLHNKIWRVNVEVEGGWKVEKIEADIVKKGTTDTLDCFCMKQVHTFYPLCLIET